MKFQFPVCEIPLTSLLLLQVFCMSPQLMLWNPSKNNAIKLSKVHMKPMRISVQISIILHATILLVSCLQDFWEFQKENWIIFCWKARIWQVTLCNKGSPRFVIQNHVINSTSPRLLFCCCYLLITVNEVIAKTKGLQKQLMLLH